MAPTQTKPKKTHDAYTVAVVCITEFEMSAVRYMFDEEHEYLAKKPGDNNSYYLGKLSRYNTVLACLPGTQGKSAAANTAANLDRTFPSIKYRFLTGIGGGVPEPHGIHLGDVVVSMPDGSSGGLVQYDLGKDNGDKGFQLKGFLSPPPEALRNAVRGMMSDHRLHGSKIEQFISEIAQKHKKIEEFCRRPPSASDVLFAADYAHTQNNTTCGGCDKERLLARLDRGSDDSKIHYGLIASGDSVIKDGTKRDSIVGRLAASGNKVLCFEMEAAGLATESSYLVIRGISDYADSHKNDVWQSYAAAAAAACTKEILEQLQHEDSEDLEASGSHGNRGTGARISHANFIGNGLQNAGNIQAGRDMINSWGRN